MTKIKRGLLYILPLLRFHSFFCTILFNLKHLPLYQAIRLPIWLYKPEIQDFSGRVAILSDNIYPGMIRLGYRGGRAFPNNGIIINVKGRIEFCGKCQIGNNSSIIIGEKGKVTFGNRFLAPTSLKIFSYCGIIFGDNTIFGWSSTIQDTNFHPLYDLSSESYRKGYGKIIIGPDNWFSQGCLVLHSVTTPERCIFAARSVITRNCFFEPYSVHGGIPLKILARNLMLNYDHYMITDYSE